MLTKDSKIQQLSAALCDQLRNAREAAGLTQADLAQMTGVSRMTVQRCEGVGADPQQSNFLAFALALNLMPKLVPIGETDAAPLPQDLVHHGYARNRTRYDLQDRDRQREAAFAKAWDKVNEHHPVGLSAVMPHLVPGCTQAQASACATAIQWLGSEVGFDFLQRTLEHAGYKLVDTQAAKPKR